MVQDRAILTIVDQ